MEDSQTGPSVGCMLTKILHYGFRRPEDFDKYEALRLSEQLAMVAVPMVTVLAMVGVARDHHRLMTRRHLPDCRFDRCVWSPSHSCSSTICEPYFGFFQCVIY